MTGHPEKKENIVKICDHTSVGMLIRREDEILLLERKKPPYGYAPPAGHIDDKGTPENAAREEVEEEVGFKVSSMQLVAEGVEHNKCRRPRGDWHHWKIYEVSVEGELKPSEDETKQAGWYGLEKINELAERTKSYERGEISEEDWEASPGLEPVWLTWFTNLKII